MTAGVLLLVVALVALLAGIGAMWALKAAPKAHRRGTRSARRHARAHAPPATAAAPPAASAEPDGVRSTSQSAQERIEAMRALLHRGDERLRQLAADGNPPDFADTQALDDPDPPTLPLDWNRRPVPPGPGDDGTPPARG